MAHFRREAVKATKKWQEGSSYAGAIAGKEGAREASPRQTVKLIKLPRSGGIVARYATLCRAKRLRCITRYFYGEDVLPKQPMAADGGALSATAPCNCHPANPSLLYLV